MAHVVKVRASKTDGLSSIPRVHIVERENRECPLTSTCEPLVPPPPPPPPKRKGQTKPATFSSHMKTKIH